MSTHRFTLRDKVILLKLYFNSGCAHVADWSWVLDIINAKKSALSSVSIVRVRIPSKVPLLKLFFLADVARWSWVTLGVGHN